MKQQWFRIKDEPVRVNTVETYDDLEHFRNFIRANLNVLGCDSETTGLDTYSRTHRLRTVQFGNEREGWVLPVELGGQFKEDAVKAIKAAKTLIFQNAPFDLQEFDKHLGIPMEDLWKKTRDSQILAKLIDPRPTEARGIGSKLEELVSHYYGRELGESVKGLMAKLAKEHKTTKAKIWEKIDLWHPEYQLYAGADPVFALRLWKDQLPKIADSARPLIGFEHEVSEICSYMSRTGFQLDVDYSLKLSAQLQGEEQACKEIAASYGCENVNSTEQVADALEELGVRIKGRTPSGKRKVDSDLLKQLAGGDAEKFISKKSLAASREQLDKVETFAKAVIDGKRAGKWRSTWVDTFLTEMDEHGRCHASINTLQARTARMSITGIPAQTLPSGDWIIRRCFLADPGHVIGSIDYMTQELRVLAALSGDKKMIEAFKNGADLHLLTAQSAWPDRQLTKDSKERKAGKATNFCKVYGGGPAKIAETAGIPFPDGKRIADAFDRAYIGVTQYSKKLAGAAARYGYVTTPSGRRLPVDADRTYAALNYVVQSTSRDVTCRALVRLHKAGFTPYLRLPIHDEIVASLPEKKAEWGANRIGDLMAETMGPLRIGTDPEVTGKSWGHGYMRHKDGSPDIELMTRHDREIATAGRW
jgi:DNA polymerase-1